MRLRALSILLLAQLSLHESCFPLQSCRTQRFHSQRSSDSCAPAISEGHCKARQLSPGFSLGRKLRSWGQLSTALALTVQQHQWAKSSTLAQSLFWTSLGDWLLFTLINYKQETDYKVEQKQSLPYLWTTHEIIVSSPSLRAFWCYLNKNNYPNCSL